MKLLSGSKTRCKGESLSFYFLKGFGFGREIECRCKYHELDVECHERRSGVSSDVELRTSVSRRCCGGSSQFKLVSISFRLLRILFGKILSRSCFVILLLLN